MRLFKILPRLDAVELGHEAVHDVVVVLGFPDFQAFHHADLDQFGIVDIIQGDQVGACFFQNAGIVLQRLIGCSHAFVDLTGSMADHLVHIRMQLAGIGGMLPCALDHFRRTTEFVHQRAPRTIIFVCLDDISERNGFGTIVFPDPFVVRQVDPDRRGRAGIADLSHYRDHFRRDAGHDLFLVIIHDRRMVFEPLRFPGNGRDPLRRFQVFDRYDAFICALLLQGILIHLDEAVHEIDARAGVLHPGDAVVIEVLGIAGTIKGD